MLIVNLGFSGLAAITALIASAFTGNGNGVSDCGAGAGTALWFGFGGLYLVGFWSLAGQTPACASSASGSTWRVPGCGPVARSGA